MQAVRGDMQRRTKSVQVLATRYHISPKTVAKQRSRTSVAAARRRSLPTLTVLSTGQEAACVAFCQLTLLTARRLPLRFTVVAASP